jgi:hypothetical protein
MRNCAQWFETRAGAGSSPSGSRLDHVLNDEFEGIAVASDVAPVEMAADHQRRRIGKTRE